MQKLKALLNSLKDPKTSEFWTIWGPIVISIVCKVSPAVCAVLGGATGAVDATPGQVLGGLMTYGFGRLISKAAKA